VKKEVANGGRNIRGKGREGNADEKYKNNKG
jgi:hypothetical protein